MLGAEAPKAWRGELDQPFLTGRPYENEVAFFHRASRTLILCDLAFDFGAKDAAPTSVKPRRGRFPLLARSGSAVGG